MLQTSHLSLSYLSLAEPLLDAVATRVAGGGVAAIVATGHSLGGSMAGLAAIDLRLQFPSVRFFLVLFCFVFFFFS